MGSRLAAARNVSDLGTAVRPENRLIEPPVVSRSRAQDAAALLCIAVAVFSALGLASAQFDPHDPRVHGSDWMGPVGAAVATLLIQGFGVVAWLFPLDLLLLSAPLFKRRRPEAIGLRVAGDLVMAIVLASLCQICAPATEVFGAARVGGNVGLFFGELMRGLFSTLGSFVVGLTSAGLILIGRSSFSFITASQRLARLLTALRFGIVAAFERLRSAWTEASRLRRAEREAEQRRAEPRIEEHASDEAIILRLEDEPGEFPFERTGPPPLALSEALRNGVRDGALLEASEALDQETPARAKAAPVNDESDDAEWGAAPEPSTAPVTPSAAKEPFIVDTKPQQEVKRADAATPPPRRAGIKLPEASLLHSTPIVHDGVDRQRVLEHAKRLEKTLADYGVSGKVEEIHPGPTVTTYEVSPEAGTKVSKVANLSDDLALGLSRKVRIIAPIPGKARLGFELPNDKRSPVNLRELIEDERFGDLAARAPLPVVLGRDIVGAPCYADLASMPHVIVAGATGAGKSVGLNVMLASLLFKRVPDELRLLMIDPKVVELQPYDGIPHMLLPVVTDMKQAATALRWAVDEMERRYQSFASAGTKNIATYNQWVERVASGEAPPPDPKEVEALSADGSLVTVPAAKHGSDGRALPGKLPYIVIVVDEFADLMMQQGKEVEASVARLAQKARAAGMHVVLATQRPSVDVITGMIKANFPSRVAFRVAQKVDSRTILDEQGAELLLGKGDMLVKLNGSNEMRRVQCPFISEEEVAALNDYLRTQGTPRYHEAILLAAEDDANEPEREEALDARFDEAVRIVADTQRCSTSWLQRKMTIGYNRAAKIVEQMEKRGMVGPPNGARDRDVYIHPQ
ncbi:MAG TPA: DNA translocase FtsK 4TM domain-containing protein [Polyangiaceae bacterium]